MQTIEYSLSFQSSDQIYDYNYALRSWRSTQSVIYHARACLKNKNCTKRMFYFPFS